MCANHFVAPTFCFKRLTTALLMLLAAGTVQAATYYVATTGNDAWAGTSAAPWKTIQKAVVAAGGGDRVIIRAGRHAPFNLRNINGAAGAPITLFGEPGAIVDANYNGGGGIRPIEFYGGSYITIDGLELTDTYQGAGPTSCTGSSLRPGAIKLNRQAGAGTPHPHHVIFKNLHIHSTGGGGIGGSGEHIEFLNNYVHHNGGKNKGWAMPQEAYATYLKGRYNIIRGNRIHDQSGNGIRTGNDASVAGLSELLVDSIIENNLIYDNGGGWMHPRGEYGTPEFQCVFTTGGDGIVVWHGSGNSVRNNVVYNNVGNGIRINEDYAVSSALNVVYNNTVYKNGFDGLAIWPRTGVVDKTVFKNNISYLSGRQNIASGILSQSNNVTVDPLFVNAAGADFHLRAGSPAINAGVNLYSAGVTKDFAGVARPQTGAFEIGAYEYGTSTLPPAFNFSLANGGNKTVTRGGSVTNTLTATLVSGTAQAVSLSVSGLPSGVTRSFSATSCTPNCSSTLTLSASTAAALGTAALTVTAAGGGISQTSAFTLTVNAPQTSTHSVTLSAAQAAPGATLTATVNGGSGSATQWVAVYLATAPDSAYSYKGNWKYLNGTQTAPTTAVPTPVQLTFAAPMDAGVYNLRFFANTGSGTRLALSSNLTVGSTTDLNGDGITNVTDIQIAVNQAAGGAACGSGDVNKDGVCNVADVQLVVNRSLGL
jgi:hypothetical protein